MIKLGVIGCGDVAFRRYLPALAELTSDVAVAACCDPDLERAERAAALFGDARSYASYQELLQHPQLDAVINLTPAPLHREIVGAALDARLHVYSEKPLANDVAEGQALIAQARRQGRLLLCAPGVLTTSRFQYLRELLDDGRIGRPTLATAQMTNMGPANWREYTGDPAVFYSAAVGPLIDTGVYALHGITGLLGPARRVQALGGIAIPQRTIAAGPFAGRAIEVAANDHMLLQLDFGANTFAQLLSSFAVMATRAPVMELHGTLGSLSLSDWYNPNGPIELFVRDDPGVWPGSWSTLTPPTKSGFTHLIDTGVAHFVACLRGEVEPLLTAEHACHVLEIMLKAREAAQTGQTIELETTF
jgi:predicted dehydrogenase